jgi:hypothetical protein
LIFKNSILNTTDSHSSLAESLQESPTFHDPYPDSTQSAIKYSFIQFIHSLAHRIKRFSQKGYKYILYLCRQFQKQFSTYCRIFMIITNLQVNNVDGNMQFLASMHQLFYDGIETSFLINFDLIHLV